MEQGKHGNSDEGESPHEKSSEAESAGVGRSYECTFCKRGFTNAQALGGHMNIHRKDKAKAKQKILHHQDQEASNNKSRYNPSTLDHPHTPPPYQRPQINYQLYLPSPNPNLQTGNYLPLWRPVDRLDANLRLGIGASPPSGDADGDVDSNVKENDVDLELRLGHHP